MLPSDLARKPKSKHFSFIDEPDIFNQLDSQFVHEPV